MTMKLVHGNVEVILQGCRQTLSNLFQFQLLQTISLDQLLDSFTILFQEPTRFPPQQYCDNRITLFF